MNCDRKNSKGFTFTETLLAMGIVALSASALTWVSVQTSKNQVKTKLIAHVMSIESELVNQLLFEPNYNSDVRTELRAGTLPPPSMAFNIKGSSFEMNYDFEIRPDSSIMLSNALTPCNTYPSRDCPLRIDLALSDVGGRYAFAYRILTNYPNISISFKGASAKLTDYINGRPVFSPEEHILPIPSEYYFENLNIQCPPGDLAVRGVNADTGTVSCIHEPQTQCPANTVPKQVQFVAASSSFELVCGNSQTAACPPNYYLNRLEMTSLDGGATKSGRCVYAGRSPASPNNPILGPSKRIRGQVCPAGYRSQSTCRISPGSVTSASGACPWCYATGMNCPAIWREENPIGTFTRYTPYMCTSPGTLVVPANAGRVVFTENTPAGSADCRLQKAQQDCGAQWDAMVELQVNCVLDTTVTPEFADVF